MFASLRAEIEEVIASLNISKILKKKCKEEIENHGYKAIAPL
jgi:hypothetical protein